MTIQHGTIKILWACGHVESTESAGWKECPSCLQGRINEVKETIERWHDHKVAAPDAMVYLSQMLEVQ